MTGAVKCVFLSLGSNLGDRVGRIQRALELMPSKGILVRRVSSYYRTAPVDLRLQTWFVNCVAEAETTLMPLQLLRALQSIERALGRRPGVPKGPRPIDIDIILYENLVVRSSFLVIPHARMEQRRFVLVPLAELNPHLRHPLSGRTVAEMLQATGDPGKVRRLTPPASVQAANKGALS